MTHLNRRLQRPLRRAGLALALFGCVDSVACGLRLARGYGYATGLGLVAVVAGLLVYRGNQRVARFVFLGAAFSLGGLLLLPLTLPMSYPARLLWLKVRLAPGEAIVAVSVVGLALTACVGVVRWLTLVPLGRLGRFGPREYRNIAVAAGACVALASALAFGLGFDQSEPFRRAIAEARVKMGPGYRFRVQTLSGTDARGRAEVLAYTDTELRTVHVQWGGE